MGVFTYNAAQEIALECDIWQVLRVITRVDTCIDGFLMCLEFKRISFRLFNRLK